VSMCLIAQKLSLSFLNSVKFRSLRCPTREISAFSRYPIQKPITGRAEPFVGFKMEEILTGFSAEFDKSALNVLVGHFTVSGGMYSKEQPVPPFDISIRKEFLRSLILPYLVTCMNHRSFTQERLPGVVSAKKT